MVVDSWITISFDRNLLFFTNLTAILLKHRMEEYMKTEVGDYQEGFRKDRSTTDQAFILKQIWKGCHEQNICTNMLFVDFKEACDNINRIKLLNALNNLKIPSKTFKTDKEIRQESRLSTTLFNLVLEEVIRENRIKREENRRDAIQ